MVEWSSRERLATRSAAGEEGGGGTFFFDAAANWGFVIFALNGIAYCLEQPLNGRRTGMDPREETLMWEDKSSARKS